MIRETQRIGILPDALMKELGMPRLPEGEHKDRTDYCISQCGPCVITKEGTRDRIQAYKAKRAPPNQVELDRIAGQKVLDAKEKDVEKKRLAQIKKDVEAN